MSFFCIPWNILELYYSMYVDNNDIMVYILVILLLDIYIYIYILLDTNDNDSNIDNGHHPII